MQKFISEITYFALTSQYMLSLLMCVVQNNFFKQTMKITV